jgi:hypothetical protein
MVGIGCHVYIGPDDSVLKRTRAVLKSGLDNAKEIETWTPGIKVISDYRGGSVPFGIGCLDFSLSYDLTFPIKYYQGIRVIGTPVKVVYETTPFQAKRLPTMTNFLKKPRLKGHPLSLRPMFLQREDHIKGLIRLLTIGLRLLTLVEFQVRRSLALEKIEIAGLYAGNPKRSTAQPTAERLFASFKEITLVLIEARGETFADLTVLNPLQERILKLMNFPIEIYTHLGPQSDDPP